MRYWCGALAVALFLSAGSAAAEEAQGAAAAAKQRYEQGKAAYRDGRFAEAIQAFSAADELAPRAALSFNIARAYEGLGDTARAIEHYRDYLGRAPEAENADAVRARISELENATRDARPAATVPAPSVASAPPASAPVAIPANPAEDADGQPTFAPWSWIALGTGGALLAGAGIAEAARRDAEGDARSAPTQLAYQADYERMHTDQSVARTLLGVGGALVVTGGVLVAIDLGRQKRLETRVACLPYACSIQGAF